MNYLVLSALVLGSLLAGNYSLAETRLRRAISPLPVRKVVKITQVTTRSTPYIGKSDEFTFSFKNLPGVKLLAISKTYYDRRYGCHFKQDPRPLGYGEWSGEFEPVTITNGRASATLTGKLEGDLFQPNCKIRLAVIVEMVNGSTRRQSAHSDERFISFKLKTYRIEKTYNFSKLLEFETSRNRGKCGGKSYGGTSYQVGKRKTVGGDLLFEVRSSPIGTDCEFSSKFKFLNPEWRIKKLKWKELSTQDPLKDTCSVSKDGRTNAPLEGEFKRGKFFTGFSGDNPSTSIIAFNEILVDFEDMVPYYLPADDATLVRKMTVKLTCGVHPTNARKAAAVLEYIEVIGPVGMNPYKDAFRN